jgi:hypothetical protein
MRFVCGPPPDMAEQGILSIADAAGPTSEWQPSGRSHTYHIPLDVPGGPRLESKSGLRNASLRHRPKAHAAHGVPNAATGRAARSTLSDVNDHSHGRRLGAATAARRSSMRRMQRGMPRQDHHGR